MASAFPSAHNLSELRQHVNQILCQHSQFEIDAFPLTERILTRRGSPCGLYFCLHGPRAVKLTAIWEAEGNNLFFYGSTGERFHKARWVRARRAA